MPITFFEWLRNWLQKLFKDLVDVDVDVDTYVRTNPTINDMRSYTRRPPKVIYISGTVGGGVNLIVPRNRAYLIIAANGGNGNRVAELFVRIYPDISNLDDNYNTHGYSTSGAGARCNVLSDFSIPLVLRENMRMRIIDEEYQVGDTEYFQVLYYDVGVLGG